MALSPDWQEDIPLPDWLKWALGMETTAPSTSPVAAYEPALQATARQGAVEGAKIADSVVTGGMVVPLLQLQYAQTTGNSNMRNEALRQLAIAAAANAAGYGIGRGIGAGVRAAGAARAARAGKEIMDVGIHHSPFGNITGQIVPSVAEKGQWAVTAGDQVPGYSYFWDTRIPEKAVSEAQFQLNRLDDRWMGGLFPDSQQSIYVTRVPRYMVEPDPNLPNSIARRLKGPQDIVEKVVRPWESVPGTGGLGVNPQILIELPDATAEATSKLADVIAANTARNNAVGRTITRAERVANVSPAMLDYPLSVAGREALLAALAKQRANERRTPNPRVR